MAKRYVHTCLSGRLPPTLPGFVGAMRLAPFSDTAPSQTGHPSAALGTSRGATLAGQPSEEPERAAGGFVVGSLSGAFDGDLCPGLGFLAETVG